MIGASRASSTRSYQLLATTTITSTGSVTIPAGTLFIEIECWGSGGGGAGRTVTTSGRTTTYYGQSGGGAGAYLKKKYQISNMQVNDTLNFTIGAAGSGGTDITVNDAPTEANGGAGGNTTLDTHKRGATTITTFSVSAGGGLGAVGSVGFFAATSGGSASGGDTNTSGGNATVGSAGGNGGAGGTAPNGGAGGAGGVNSSNAVAQAGVAPGGGGGGARGENVNGVNNLGAAGGNGKVTVKYYG